MRRVRREMFFQLHGRMLLQLFRRLRKSLHLLWVKLHQQLLFRLFLRLFRLLGLRLDLWRRLLLRLHGGLRRKLLRELWLDLYRLQRWVRLDL